MWFKAALYVRRHSKNSRAPSLIPHSREMFSGPPWIRVNTCTRMHSRTDYNSAPRTATFKKLCHQEGKASGKSSSNLGIQTQIFLSEKPAPGGLPPCWVAGWYEGHRFISIYWTGAWFPQSPCMRSLGLSMCAVGSWMCFGVCLYANLNVDRHQCS